MAAAPTSPEPERPSSALSFNGLSSLRWPTCRKRTRIYFIWTLLSPVSMPPSAICRPPAASLPTLFSHWPTRKFPLPPFSRPMRRGDAHSLTLVRTGHAYLSEGLDRRLELIG